MSTNCVLCRGTHVLVPYSPKTMVITTHFFSLIHWHAYFSIMLAVHGKALIIQQYTHSDVYKVTCSATVRSAFIFIARLISELNRAVGDYHDGDLVILVCVICHCSASSISEWDTKAARGSEAPFCSTRPFISINYGEIYLRRSDTLKKCHHAPSWWREHHCDYL